MATLNVAVLSSEQREIWQAEQAYWALVKNRDIEGLIGLAHDRVTAWPHVASAPMDSVGSAKTPECAASVTPSPPLN